MGAGAKSARRFGGAEPDAARRRRLRRRLRRRRKPSARALKAGRRSAQAPGNRALATQDARENLKAAASLSQPLRWDPGVRRKSPTEEDWRWMSGPGGVTHTLTRLFIKCMEPACPSSLRHWGGNGRRLKNEQHSA